MSSAADDWEAARYANRRLRERISPFGRSGSVLGLVLTALLGLGGWLFDVVSAPDSPAALTDGSAIVLADGRVFVFEQDTLYPAANLTSAMLAAERIERRDELDIDRYQIGAPRGIPGALAVLPQPQSLLPADWQLCEGANTPTRFTVGAAPYLPPPSGSSALVSDGSGVWMLTGAGRHGAPSDLAEQAVVVSPTLISLVPESRDPTPPPTSTDAADRISSGVVCVQSDPLAPYAQPSAAAIARQDQRSAPMNNGIQVVLPAGSGLLVHRADGDGYWLVSYSGELAPIADDAALGRLGYEPADALDVPPQLLALLEPGPELSIEAAKSTL